jgi:hypothetical protein
MGDRAAEGCFLCRSLGIAMDELVIVRRIGELVDHRLRNHAPRGNPDFRSDPGQKLVNRYRFQENALSYCAAKDGLLSGPAVVTRRKGRQHRYSVAPAMSSGRAVLPKE